MPLPAGKKAKFLLVNQLQFGERFIPLGLLQVASAVEARLSEQGLAGRVRILETFDALKSKEHYARFVDRLRAEAISADVVGFSDFTFYGIAGLRALVETARSANPRAAIILGGFGPSLSPEHYFERLRADVIFPGVHGEALQTLRLALPDLLGFASDPAAARRRLAAIPGMYLQGKSTGPPPAPPAHSRVNWDIARFGLDVRDYVTPEPGNRHFPYGLDVPSAARTAPRPARIVIPYQFHRISCPNHAFRDGCTFCAMSLQVSRLRAAGGTTGPARHFAAEQVLAELRDIRRFFGEYSIHLFVADDCMTGGELRLVGEALARSGLSGRLESVGMFVRPDLVTSGFLEQLAILKRQKIRAVLFVGFDFLCQNLHDFSRTRKTVGDYPAVIRRLAQAKGASVVAAFILTHPRMTPDDFREHLRGIMDVAFKGAFEIALSPFIFVVESEALEKNAVAVAYRGNYIGAAFRRIFGEDVKPKIEPFRMSSLAVEETLGIIEDSFRTLKEMSVSSKTNPTAETNGRRLSIFLRVVYDHFVSLNAVPHRSGDERHQDLLPGEAASKDPCPGSSPAAGGGRGESSRRKALIKVGYSCNNNCVFCHSAALGRHWDLTTGEVEARVDLAKNLGAEMIVFSGGEPTIREDIVDLARLVQARGLGVGLVTNGRRFVYRKFGEQLASLGLRYVYVSFHAATRERHRLSARSDSFHQTLGAIGNLVQLGAAVTVNTVVTAHNIHELRGIVDMIGALRPGAIKLSVVEPKGNALDDSALCPPLEASARAIAAAVRYGRSKYGDIKFGCEGLTPCLLKEFETTNDDLFTNGFVLFQDVCERHPSAPDYANRGKSVDCSGCAESNRCPGIFEKYLEMGPVPLRPPGSPILRGGGHG